MRNLLFGISIGTVLGLALSSYAATISGGSSLSGWTVTEIQVCEDPDVDYQNREIQCPEPPDTSVDDDR